MKTLATFKNENMNETINGETVTHCKSVNGWREDAQGKYLVALNYAKGWGWNVLYVERADSQTDWVTESVNVDGAAPFGTTYDDAIDSLFGC